MLAAIGAVKTAQDFGFFLYLRIIRAIGQKVCIKSVVCTGKQPIFCKQFKKIEFFTWTKSV